MVNIQSPNLDLVFYALSDPTRRQILKMLHEGAHTIGSLSEPFKISLQAISKHIKILEKAKLLNRKKMGRIHECSINPDALKNAEECIQFYTKFWDEQLDLFAQKIESKPPKRRK